MKIIIDTREAKPLRFKVCRYLEGTKREKLDVGDYAVEFRDGYRPDIFFERKSLGDLYSTLSGGYRRFKREILRAQESNSQLIIIVEDSLTKVSTGYEYSKRSPGSLVSQIFTLLPRHGIWTVFCTSRAEMAEYIKNFFIACGKEYVRRNK